jgi:PKD repeat protein
MKKLSIVSLCILALMLVSHNAIAKGSWVGRWENIYRDSLSNNSGCMLCHGSSTSNLNGYGLEIKIEKDRIGDIDSAIQNVEGIDSDIDLGGFLNLEEINAGAQPGWTDGPNNSIYDRGDGSTSGTNLNAPDGIQGILDPITENQAPVAKANGPYSGNVGDAISFSSSGSSDADGSIETYLWSFGDGNTSIDSNPTHTYLAADTYTVTLTVTDDQGATNSDTSTAKITEPPVNEPDINLSSNSFNFSQVEIGNTQSRATEVKNIGTETLNVAGITLCDGTSTEYTWSPDTLQLDPGAGQTLTVFYNPVDQNSDEGCLKIASNDPDESSVFLNLTGSGFTLQPELLDVDIAGFRVTKRVSFKRVKPIKIKLIVKNNSTVTNLVEAAVTGRRGGTEVYNEKVTVEINSGRVTLSLPAHIPLANGNIDWTAEIHDEDPDRDNATTTTKVVP